MGENMLGELGLENKRCIAFTGAGGKTTAVYTCVREMREEGLPAAAVTTTKMWKPQEGFLLWRDDLSAEEVKEWIRLHGMRPVTIGRELPDGKIGSIPLNALKTLVDQGVRLCVEADGAKGKWIKIPNDREPVVPDFCDAVIGILNQKALGKSFLEVAHRPEICAERLGKRPEDLVEMKDLCRLWLDKDGIFQNCRQIKRAVLSGVEPGMGEALFKEYREVFRWMRQQEMPVYIWERNDDRQRVFRTDQESL